MYYIYSLIVSFVIFVILQQFLLKKKNQDNDVIKNNYTENIFTFIIIYGITTLLFYFGFEKIYIDKTDDIKMDTEDIGKSIKSNVDINMLRKIPEEVSTGFQMNDTD
jgi:membrane-anchored glycerophosphoryl diester phosphodiesterase (GDPDase)